MKCEACDGDGQIEVGAYRGDEDDPNTRECRLCGGVIANATTEWKSYGSASKAAEALTALGQAATRSGIALKESTSGVRRTVIVIENAQNWTAHEKSCRCPPCAQFWAKRTAAEWNERLRQENDLKRRQSEADAAINKFLRGKL